MQKYFFVISFAGDKCESRNMSYGRSEKEFLWRKVCVGSCGLYTVQVPEKFASNGADKISSNSCSNTLNMNSNFLFAFAALVVCHKTSHK